MVRDSSQAVSVFLFAGGAPSIRAMLTCADIRRGNLRFLEDQLRGRENLCRTLDKDPKFISQLIGKNPTRNIGDTLAREIESLLDLDKGWMDNIHEDLPQEAMRVARLWASLGVQDRETIIGRINTLLAVKKAATGIIERPRSPTYEAWEQGVVKSLPKTDKKNRTTDQ